MKIKDEVTKTIEMLTKFSFNINDIYFEGAIGVNEDVALDFVNGSNKIGLKVEVTKLIDALVKSGFKHAESVFEGRIGIRETTELDFLDKLVESNGANGSVNVLYTVDNQIRLIEIPVLAEQPGQPGQVSPLDIKANNSGVIRVIYTGEGDQVRFVEIPVGQQGEQQVEQEMAGGGQQQ